MARQQKTAARAVAQEPQELQEAQEIQEAAEVIEAGATAPGRSLFDRVAGYLDGEDWHYSANEEKRYFDMRSRIQDASVRVVVEVYEAEEWQRVVVYSLFPIYVPERRRTAALEGLNRINYALEYGNFEMDPKDGEVRLRTVVEAERDLAETLLERALYSNLRTASRFFAPFFAVAFGHAEPANITDLAAAPEAATLQ